MRHTGTEKAEVNNAKKKHRQSHCSSSQGRLNIVGIGPGDIRYLSQRAREVIENSEVIVGYTSYIRLLGRLIYGKELVQSGMRQEVERARCSIRLAEEGKNVSLISGGDAGIYGMAGVVLEILDRKNKFEIEIIPGISAASACASLLGAPLMHDFAVISLSDILTDRCIIKKRIEMAVEGGFVIVFYNPRSKKRVVPIETAWHILMKHMSATTPVGIVKNAYRDSQKLVITELRYMLSEEIDMATTIIVGNNSTYVKNGYMITPRGYDLISGR